MKEIAVTYDIACQYKKHFYERIEALPAVLRTLPVPDITWGLPVWHGNVHEIDCETSESLKYKVGVGKTDGEGIERVWSLLNPFSYMTRDQLPGARHDDIEDKCDHHNFLKNIGLGMSCASSLKAQTDAACRKDLVEAPSHSVRGANESGRIIQGG